MNKVRFFFILIFFLIYSLDNCAMQSPSKSITPIPSSITQEIPLDKEPWIIMCTTPSWIEVEDTQNYTKINYDTKISIIRSNNEEDLFDKIRMNTKPENIYFHPIENKVFFINRDKLGFYKNYDYRRERPFKYTYFSALFSSQGPLMYVVREEDLACYNYEGRYTQRLVIKNKKLGTLFAYPCPQQPYFLCSNRSEEKMYKIELLKKDAHFFEQKISIKKLFKFPFPVDLSSWVYCSQEQLFFFINKKSRALHVFDIKNIKNIKKLKEKKYQYDSGFPIAAIRLHPYASVLVLLSMCRGFIQYVDIKNYQTIRHLLTTTHEPFGYDEYSACKMAFSCDGAELWLAGNKKCCRIQIPLGALGAAFSKKTFIMNVFDQSHICKDIRRLIWYFLFNLLRKEQVATFQPQVKKL